jgi:hypothetical protein
MDNVELLYMIKYWRWGVEGYEIEGYTMSGMWISLFRGGEIIDGYQDLKRLCIPQVG